MLYKDQTSKQKKFRYVKTIQQKKKNCQETLLKRNIQGHIKTQKKKFQTIKLFYRRKGQQIKELKAQKNDYLIKSMREGNIQRRGIMTTTN